MRHFFRLVLAQISSGQTFIALVAAHTAALKRTQTGTDSCVLLCGFVSVYVQPVAAANPSYAMIVVRSLLLHLPRRVITASTRSSLALVHVVAVK